MRRLTIVKYLHTQALEQERKGGPVQRLVRPTDIHDHAVGIKLLRHEGRIDHESRAMQRRAGPNSSPRNE
jgi:hypothetical protein